MSARRRASTAARPPRASGGKMPARRRPAGSGWPRSACSMRPWAGGGRDATRARALARGWRRCGQGGAGPSSPEQPPGGPATTAPGSIGAMWVRGPRRGAWMRMAAMIRARCMRASGGGCRAPWRHRRGVAGGSAPAKPVPPPATAAMAGGQAPWGASARGTSAAQRAPPATCTTPWPASASSGVRWAGPGRPGSGIVRRRCPCLRSARGRWAGTSAGAGPVRLASSSGCAIRTLPGRASLVARQPRR